MHAKPRAYEPHRLLDAIRAQTRVLVAVALVALFGGAAVARWAIPDVSLARAGARIGYEPHAVLSRANEETVLRGAGATTRQVAVTFRGSDRLWVEVRDSEDERARELATHVVAGYVALANERAQALRVQRTRARELELARAKSERAAAQRALDDALPAERAEAEARLRSQLAELDGALQSATLSAQARPSNKSRADLAEAQRKLSRLLAQGGDDQGVTELRAKITRLQRAAEAPSLGNLKARLESKRGELAKLTEATASVAPLRQALQAAELKLSELSEHVEPDDTALRSAIDGPASVESISRRPLRVLASLLAPLLALLILVVFLVARELTDLRVCEATELAHWLAVPVLTSTSWPRRNDALEALVDALADPALESLGTTLILPLSEIERPLAHTLTAQLNARAQRQYRSRTGSRVTIAQDWQGDLDSARIERAASAADRVLWVVAADAHRGEELATRRALVKRQDGVAAVLVDAQSATVRSVGAAREFWKARTAQPEPLATVEASPQLH